MTTYTPEKPGTKLANGSLLIAASDWEPATGSRVAVRTVLAGSDDEFIVWTQRREDGLTFTGQYFTGDWDGFLRATDAMKRRVRDGR